MVAIGPKRIGIKYCGGCNPHYERGDLVQKVRSLMKDGFLFLRQDQENLDGLILVNGCPRICAVQNLNETEIPCRLVVKENDLESLIDWLRTIDGKRNL
jgi:hypothetical protein